MRPRPRRVDVFKHANERIEAWVLRSGYDGDLLPFLCECPVLSCTRPMRVSHREYTRIRSHPGWFITVPGHESGVRGGARIVERCDGYIVVEQLTWQGDVTDGAS